MFIEVKDWTLFKLECINYYTVAKGQLRSMLGTTPHENWRPLV